MMAAPRTVKEFRELTVTLGLFQVRFHDGQIQSLKVEEHEFEPGDFTDGRAGLIRKIDQCASDLATLRDRVRELIETESKGPGN